MGPFDVHLNQGRTRASVPFVLVIQSDRCEATTHRVIVPLVLRAELRTPDRDLNPSFTIDGQVVVMDTLQLATLPTKALGPKVGILDQEHQSIIRAMDAPIAQDRQPAVSRRRTTDFVSYRSSASSALREPWSVPDSVR